MMTKCRDCSNTISTDAPLCPHCGAPYPWKENWDGYGWEWKSKATIGSLPLVHISFKYKKNKMPVVAKGVIAIGQFSQGIFSISQFGISLIGIHQFGIAALVVGQFVVGGVGLCQFGILWQGMGQLVIELAPFFQ